MLPRKPLRSDKENRNTIIKRNQTQTISREQSAEERSPKVWDCAITPTFRKKAWRRAWSKAWKKPKLNNSRLKERARADRTPSTDRNSMQHARVLTHNYRDNVFLKPFFLISLFFRQDDSASLTFPFPLLFQMLFSFSRKQNKKARGKRKTPNNHFRFSY